MAGIKVNLHLSNEGMPAMLMHADTLADPLNPRTKEFKRVSAKRTKTDEDYELMAEMEFVAALYVNEGVISVPSRNVVKCLVEGARITKSGPKVERGLSPDEIASPLVYRGPQDPNELYRDKNFVSRMTVKVGTSKTVRCRPMFRAWALDVPVTIDPAVLSVDELRDIATDAGAMIGLGDYRKGGGFGRFAATVSAG